MARAADTISFGLSGNGLLVGMTGTPQEIARFRAATLLPKRTHGLGWRTNEHYTFARTSIANSELSDRKP